MAKLFQANLLKDVKAMAPEERTVTWPWRFQHILLRRCNIKISGNIEGFSR